VASLEKNRKYAAHNIIPAYGGKDVLRSQRGALSELRVSVKLIELGYEVYRAMSSHSSCDMVAIKNGKTLRIEVKSGATNRKTGTRSFSVIQAPSQHDVVAAVFHDQIIYSPELS
jgi:PD-(D/E)XK endonuclease